MLNITKDQQEKLASLLRDVEAKQHEILNPNDDKRPENEVIQEKPQKLKALNAERDKTANQILTPAQQEKFAQMKGKPFDLTQLPPPFSPPRGAGRTSGHLGMPTSVDPSFMHMVQRESILKELGIEEDAPQVAELRKLADAYSKDFRNSIRDHTPVDAASLPELSQKLQARFDPELRKVLTPQQYTRLRQIIWQLPGANRLDDPDLVKALDITPEQREKLDALTVEIFRKRVAILNPNSGRGPADVDAPKKMTELNVEWSKKINEILSASQQEKLAELKGKPFDASLLQSSPSGVGGGLPGQKSEEKKEETKE